MSVWGEHSGALRSGASRPAPFVRRRGGAKNPRPPEAVGDPKFGGLPQEEVRGALPALGEKNQAFSFQPVTYLPAM